MKKILYLLILCVSIISCEKISTEGLMTKEEALDLVNELDAKYSYAERYMSMDIIKPSSKIKYDYWDHSNAYTSPNFKSWLICYDWSSTTNGGGLQLLVFVDAGTGKIVSEEISATEIHVKWDTKYYYCPPMK